MKTENDLSGKDKSFESALASAAQAAETGGAGDPLGAAEPGAAKEPEIVEDIPFELDPAQQHAIMVAFVRGTVKMGAMAIEAKFQMKMVLPEDREWWDAYTQSVEVVLEKYIGKISTSPLGVLVGMTATGLVLPNLPVSLLFGGSKGETENG
jgi:hypothetical protein